MAVVLCGCQEDCVSEGVSNHSNSPPEPGEGSRNRIPLYHATRARRCAYIADIVRVRRGVEALAAAAGLGGVLSIPAHWHLASSLHVPTAWLPLRDCAQDATKSTLPVTAPSPCTFHCCARRACTIPRISCRVPELCNSPQAPPRCRAS
jgi:hypothetical protein